MGNEPTVAVWRRLSTPSGVLLWREVNKIVELRIKNFKSFREEVVVSFAASTTSKLSATYYVKGTESGL